MRQTTYVDRDARRVLWEHIEGRVWEGFRKEATRVLRFKGYTGFQNTEKEKSIANQRCNLNRDLRT